MKERDMGLWCQGRLEEKRSDLCQRGQVVAASLVGSGEDCSCLGGFHVKLMQARSVLSKPRSYLPVPHDTRAFENAFSQTLSSQFLTSTSQSCICCASQRTSGDSKLPAISSTLSRSSPSCSAFFSNLVSQHVECTPGDGPR